MSKIKPIKAWAITYKNEIVVILQENRRYEIFNTRFDALCERMALESVIPVLISPIIKKKKQ